MSGKQCMHAPSHPRRAPARTGDSAAAAVVPASQSIAAQSNRGRALSWAHPLPNRARTCHRGAPPSGPTRRSGHILAPIGTHQNVTQLRMPDAVAGTSSATERLAGGSAASDEKSKLITGMGAESMAACCLPKLSVAARCSRSAQACVALTISGDHRLSVVNFMNAHLRPQTAISQISGHARRAPAHWSGTH